MKHLLSILLICSIGFTQELTVEGDLNVTGNIQNQTIDSLQQQISSLLLLIAELEFRIENMECLNHGIIPEGYCDCNGNILDTCGVCNGDGSLCAICDGVTEVELWGEVYDIETTIEINRMHSELTGSIPPEIGCLTNLTELYLHSNQIQGSIPIQIGFLTNLTELFLYDNQLIGEIPVEVCELIESNDSLYLEHILQQNNLINTCE